MAAGLSHLFVLEGKDAVTATRQAHGAMWGLVQQQAAMLSYNDVFRILAGMFIVMFPLIFLMTKPKKRTPVIAH